MLRFEAVMAPTSVLILLTMAPLTALSASLPDIASTTEEQLNTRDTRSIQPHLSTGAVVALIAVPAVILIIASASLFIYCRRRGHSFSFGATSKIREIANTVPSTNTQHRGAAFYELGRKEGYESITPLHPTLESDSPRSSTAREPWRSSHARNDSMGSAASLQTGLSMSGHDQRYSGRYTPVSGRESPALGRGRTRTHTASSNISLPLQGGEHDHRRCSSPLAWTAEQIHSDGSDRATPVPWEYRAETEGRSRSVSGTPYMQHARAFSPPRTMSPEQDIASMSPYYDPHIAERRMSIPMVLAIPASPGTPLSIHRQTIGETVPVEEDEDEEPRHDLQGHSDEQDDNGVNRSQTQKSMNSVTTIRTSVDTQFTDWQLPRVEEHEEMPRLPKDGLRRSSAMRRTSTGLLFVGLE